MRRALGAILLVLLLLGGGAVGTYALLEQSPPLRGEGPPLDPRLARYRVLAAERATFALTWNDGAPPVFTYFRDLRGWEALGGVPHARIEWATPSRRGDRVWSTEWLRPVHDPRGAAALLCSRRKVGLVVHAIEPPMPVLRTPLTPGATWSWAGTVGGQPAAATFKILAPGEGGSLRVEQTSRTGSQVSVRVQEYAPGRGLVAEQGTFPVDDAHRVRQDRMHAKRIDR